MYIVTIGRDIIDILYHNLLIMFLVSTGKQMKYYVQYICFYNIF